MWRPVEHRYPQSFKVQVGNQRGHSPDFTKNKSKKKLTFKIICYKKIKLYKKFVKVYLYIKSVCRVLIVTELDCQWTTLFPLWTWWLLLTILIIKLNWLYLVVVLDRLSGLLWNVQDNLLESGIQLWNKILKINKTHLKLKFFWFYDQLDSRRWEIRLSFQRHPPNHSSLAWKPVCEDLIWTRPAFTSI